MDIILVPGFWLDGSSWSEVTPPLEATGHRVHPLTLPGLDAVDAPRAGIGLRDHVDAVVAVIDRMDAPVILVGHSGGGAIIHAAVDARPDRVTRAVYVDSGPLGDGDSINDGLAADGDNIPLPPWEDFEDADLVDLDDGLRAAFRTRAVPEPRAVAYDAQQLHDERRYNVPVTIITCQFPSRAAQGVDTGRASLRGRTGPDARRGIRRSPDRTLAAVHQTRRAGHGHPRGGGPPAVRAGVSPVAQSNPAR